MKLKWNQRILSYFSGKSVRGIKGYDIFFIYVLYKYLKSTKLTSKELSYNPSVLDSYWKALESDLLDRVSLFCSLTFPSYNYSVSGLDKKGVLGINQMIGSSFFHVNEEDRNDPEARYKLINKIIQSIQYNFSPRRSHKISVFEIYLISLHKSYSELQGREAENSDLDFIKLLSTDRNMYKNKFSYDTDFFKIRDMTIFEFIDGNFLNHIKEKTKSSKTDLNKPMRIFIFSGLHWGLIKLLLETQEIVLNGGVKGRRHQLTTTQYNLSSFLYLSDLCDDPTTPLNKIYANYKEKNYSSSNSFMGYINYENSFYSLLNEDKLVSDSQEIKLDPDSNKPFSLYMSDAELYRRKKIMLEANNSFKNFTGLNNLLSYISYLIIRKISQLSIDELEKDIKKFRFKVNSALPNKDTKILKNEIAWREVDLKVLNIQLEKAESYVSSGSKILSEGYLINIESRNSINDSITNIVNSFLVELAASEFTGYRP